MMIERPEFITSEQIKRWLPRMQEEMVHPTSLMIEKLVALGFPKDKNFFEELYLSGRWLSEVLEVEGVKEDIVNMVGYAFGQKSFFYENPWVVAQECLDQFHTGIWDRPGKELADKLNDKFLKDKIRW